MENEQSSKTPSLFPVWEIMKNQAVEVLKRPECMEMTLRWSRVTGRIEFKYLLDEEEFVLGHLVIDDCGSNRATIQSLASAKESDDALDAFDRLKLSNDG
jgi:hypothetical protein